MSKKTIIGLTGNIGAGKSVVRRMLEHLGAYGIDADALSHRAIANGAPGYQRVIDEFGAFVVGPDGEIDRKKLGKLVFSDPDALKRLEGIVHPLVRQAIKHLTSKARHDVVVIEAIKLLESPIRDTVDSIWVVAASETVQVERLVKKRGMSEADARARLANQTDQALKVAEADVVIANHKSVEDTWNQVWQAWQEMFPDQQDSGVMKVVTGGLAKDERIEGPLTVRRAKPRQADDIATLITRLSNGKRALTRMGVMEAFGEKAFMLLLAGERLVGVMGWQVENLVSRTDDLWLEPQVPLQQAMQAFIPAIEDASNQLQAEAVLCFVSAEQARDVEAWNALGYEQRSPESLSVTAWQEAAHESRGKHPIMFFKQLRLDRILRPM